MTPRDVSLHRRRVQARCQVIFVTDGTAGRFSVASNLTMSGAMSGSSQHHHPHQAQNFTLHVQNTRCAPRLSRDDDEFMSIGSANFWDRSMTGAEASCLPPSCTLAPRTHWLPT